MSANSFIAKLLVQPNGLCHSFSQNLVTVLVVDPVLVKLGLYGLSFSHYLNKLVSVDLYILEMLRMNYLCNDRLRMSMAVTELLTVVMITWPISMILPDITLAMTSSCLQLMVMPCQCWSVVLPMTRTLRWTLDLHQVSLPVSRAVSFMEHVILTVHMTLVNLIF